MNTASTLYALTAANLAAASLVLSDGTEVEGVKITSKDNIQVRVPADHPTADDGDTLKIFRRDGSHYKDNFDVTLGIKAAPATEAAPAPAPAADAEPMVGTEVEASNDDDFVVIVLDGVAYQAFPMGRGIAAAA